MNMDIVTSELKENFPVIAVSQTSSPIKLCF
jgi:hypothetical protein